MPIIIYIYIVFIVLPMKEHKVTHPQYRAFRENKDFKKGERKKYATIKIKT